MKSTLTIFVCCLFSTALLAQKPDKALSRVSYFFTHIQDTTQKDSPYTENMLLVIGKNASLYTSFDKVTNSITRKKLLEEQLKNQGGNANISINIDNSGIKSVSQLDYFYFAKEQKLLVKERVLNNYLVDESSIINWKITKDTANLSGIHCQKATANFKGRNWIVWFAPSLPFQTGPWKLNGLPGLILEAQDDKNQVSFKFRGMENLSATNTENSSDPYLGAEIKLPADGIKTTRADLEKLKLARATDPQGFIKTQTAGNNAIMVVGTSMSVTATKNPMPKKVINNPLELPEK